jgi:hypothetical protein
LTNSLLREPPVLLGSQRPRHSCVPVYESTTGTEAIELCSLAGLDLDPWQQWVLRGSLGELPTGMWAAPSVGVVVPRQNGKGGILEARELTGLFLLGEPLIIHSAHEAATANEAFERLVNLIMGTPSLRKMLPTGGRKTRGISRARGNEGIRLANGHRVKFRTRTKGGGRGFTAHCLILDEAMILPDEFLNATFMTLSAVPNPQVWYTGSAVDQQEHEHGLVLARLREQGIRGTDPRLFYAEWSAADTVAQVTAEFADTPDAWQLSNPALGIRISPEWLKTERHRLSLRGFAVERLGAGDWPATTDDAAKIIPPADWRACAKPAAKITGRWALAIDVSPTRTGAISRCGWTDDGTLHTEVIEHRRGEPPTWMVQRVVEIVKSERPTTVALDGGGPAGSLLPQLEKHDRDVRLTLLGAKELAQACGLFYDGVIEHSLTHSDTAVLNEAVDGADRRSLGDSWAWDRKHSAVDISPLVACTIAHMAAKGLKSGVGVASFDQWQKRLTPEAIAEKQRKANERIEAILAKHRPT